MGKRGLKWRGVLWSVCGMGLWKHGRHTYKNSINVSKTTYCFSMWVSVSWGIVSTNSNRARSRWWWLLIPCSAKPHDWKSFGLIINRTHWNKTLFWIGQQSSSKKLFYSSHVLNCSIQSITHLNNQIIAHTDYRYRASLDCYYTPSRMYPRNPSAIPYSISTPTKSL